MDIDIKFEHHEPLTPGKCRVIAEAGANHNNSVERAIELARRAAEAGAWAVKYQLYKAESIAIPESPKYWSDPFATRTQFEAFQLSDKLEYEEFGEVAHACRDLGIIFFATPFDLGAVDTLEVLGAPLYKIASADITFRKLIEYVGETGKPVIISTGAATADEIDQAIEWSGLGPEKLVLLICTLTYPCPDEDANFARLTEFKDRFHPYLCGVSDHTLGTAGAWMTAALGGICIEKHFTLDKALPDVPDHAMSVNPDELAEMVEICNRASELRGESWIGVRDSEQPAREHARRSIVLRVDVARGEVLRAEHLDFKRPGTGLPPHELSAIVGRRAAADLSAGKLLVPSDVSWD